MKFIRALGSQRAGGGATITLPPDAFDGTAFEDAEGVRYTGLADGVAASPGDDFAISRGQQIRFSIPASRIAELGWLPGEDQVLVGVKRFGLRVRRVPKAGESLIRGRRMDSNEVIDTLLKRGPLPAGELPRQIGVTEKGQGATIFGPRFGGVAVNSIAYLHDRHNEVEVVWEFLCANPDIIDKSSIESFRQRIAGFGEEWGRAAREVLDSLGVPPSAFDRGGGLRNVERLRLKEKCDER